DTPYSATVRGDRFERETTFGHTGYTGTSYWIDPVNKCFVVLLTNRVHPSDAKGKVSRVRREVATAVAEAFLGPAPVGEPASAGGSVSTSRATDRPAKAGSPTVLCGIDVLERDHFRQLDDRRIALITNQTGRTIDGRRTLDLLAGAKNCKLVKLFSPEHGLFGKPDEKVGNMDEEKNGLPALSLYGETTSPIDDVLEVIDTDRMG